jgi:hypothetical protein
MERLDPRGMTAPGDLVRMAATGQCFELAGDGVHAVCVVHMRNGCMWVDALKGDGPVDLVDAVDRLLTAAAELEHLQAIALQTQRRGLVKKLQSHGYRVTGWVMRKDLQ